MAGAVVEIIAAIAEAAAVAGEVAAESAAVAEEAAVAAEISTEAVVVSESLEEVAGVEVESLVSEIEATEVSTVVETEVESITETEVEAEVETEVEESVDESTEEEAAGESSTGSAKAIAKTIGKWLNRLMIAYMIVDSIGKFIENLLHPSKSEKKLTDEQKKLLSKLSDASDRLKNVLTSWKEGIQPLKNIDLGELEIKDKDGKTSKALVTDVLDGLLQRSEKELTAIKPLVSNMSSVPSDSTFNQLNSGLYKALIPLDTICYLKTSGKANVLKMFKFPTESDCNEVTDILNTDFDMDAKKKAMEEVNKVLTQAIKNQAKAAAMAAATQLIKPEVLNSVKTEVNEKYVPIAKEEAKKAARSAAKHKANSFKDEMIAYAMIPFYGSHKVHQLEKKAKRESKQAAEDAAKRTVSQYMNSIKGKIKILTKDAVGRVYNERKQQVHTAIKQATSVVFQKALKEHFRKLFC